MQDKFLNMYLGENDLKAHIKSGGFKPCYLIFGEEHYLTRNYVEKIVATSVDAFPEFNVSRFDGNVKVQEVYDAVQSFPMMSARKVVTLCDFPFDKASSGECEKLINYLDEIPATTVFVMWCETVEINPKKPGDKFKKLMKAVEAADGAVIHLGRKSESEIVRMLQAGAARRKCRLDPNVARYMIQNCSDDLGTLVNELEKLCMFVGENGVIQHATVDKVCSRSVEASVYNVSKAVLGGDLDGACRLLDDLFYMNTDPAYILTFLASAYIDIYRVFAARNSGRSVNDVAKEFGYGNLAFKLNDADRHVKKFSEKQITDSLKVLRECDRLIKGSRTDNRVALEKVLVELTVIASGGKV